ncbi:MAG: diacylglycerol kinase family lipid kinase [Bacteroidota bacterium]|nr:diacylglycerol kinase family lipid kinase [Bacteroidota bacterium]
MEPSFTLNILFIINPASGGKKKIKWEPIIRNYFKQLSYQIDFFILRGNGDASSVGHWIKKLAPQKVVAVGGDGTISMVAEQLMGTSIPMGILRGGSANGMATELDIPQNPTKALETILKGDIIKCDVVKINDKEICIHLSDLGMNARMVKYYHKNAIHGMWGYSRMILKILIQGKPVISHISADNLETDIPAYMIVIANASKYGTGAVINPKGSIDDGKFELVVVRQISFIEFVKMFLKRTRFDPKKVEIFQTTKALITTKRANHFQVDGEYIGKVNRVSAVVMPSAIHVIIPNESADLSKQ